MKFLKVLFLACMLALQACALPPSGKELQLQIYVCFPDENYNIDNVRLGFIKEHSMVTNSKLRKTDIKSVDGHNIYGGAYIIDNARWRKLVIDLTDERKSLIVYDLDIPKYIQELDWSEWIKADYNQEGAYTSFLVMQSSPEGIALPPADAPKIMFRVLNMHLYWDYLYGRKTEAPISIPTCK